jgi:hypothetical protein
LAGKDKFKWLSGLELIGTYKKETGFTSSEADESYNQLPTLDELKIFFD